MPKPVLSDSLFNADDVATAVIGEANLQIANSSLGVTDVSNKITWSKFFTGTFFQTNHVYKFLNFIIFNYRGSETFSTLGGYDTIGVLDSDIRPHKDMFFFSFSHEGEGQNAIIFEAGGNIKLDTPFDPGDSAYRMTLSGIYYIDN